jgi:hypothetical protein
MRLILKLTIVWTLSLAAILLIAGVQRLVSQPAPEEQEVFGVKAWLALVVGAIGLVTFLYGLGLNYAWSEHWEKVIAGTIPKEANDILIGFFVVVAGLALIFLSVLPCRAEERKNVWMRRLVYGVNAFSTGVLLFLVLGVGNLLAHKKMPGRIDVTERGFYSLDPTSEEFLRKIDQPVKIYSIMPSSVPVSGRDIGPDIRALLDNCEEVNPKIKVEHVPPSGVDRIIQLAKQYPQLANLGTDSSGLPLGLFIVFNDDANMTGFVGVEQMVGSSELAEGEMKRTFQAESKLLNELSFLAEKRTKPIVYLTQGNEELPFSDPGNPIRKALEDRYFDVRPLACGINDYKSIPEDAQMIVVLAPSREFGSKVVKDLEAWMKPATGKKKGKLVVFLDSEPDPKNPKAFAKTGLEGLLLDFDVHLGEAALYTADREAIRISQTRTGPAINITGVLTVDARVNSDLPPTNPLVRAFADRNFRGRGARTVESQGQGAQLRSETLLKTTDRLPIWEDVPSLNPKVILTTLDDFEKSADFRREKKYSYNPRSVAVLVSEKIADDRFEPRLAAFGSLTFAVDGEGKSFDLFIGTLDWLRERPNNIAIAPRDFGSFKLDKSVDHWRIIWIPMILITASVLFLGAGVWFIRRR